MAQADAHRRYFDTQRPRTRARPLPVSPDNRRGASGTGVDFLVERMTRQGITRQGITRQATVGTAQVAASAVGLQAQDVGAARLGVHARSGGLDEADVVKACEVERSVVRTWLMRATVHLVAAEDVRWMVALFGPMIERRFANVRWRQLGIDERLIETAIELAYQVLKVAS